MLARPQFALFSTLIVLLLTGAAVGFQQPKISRTTNEKSEEYKQLLELIRAGNLPAAEKLIDFHLTKHPHDVDVWMLRRPLANGLIRQSKRNAANQQFEKLVNYMLENPTESRPILKHLPSILISISYVQQGQEPKTSQLLYPVIKLLSSASKESPSNAAFSAGVSSAVNLLARTKMRSEKIEEAIGIYREELERLRQRRNSAPENPAHWNQLAYNLKSAFDTIGDGQRSVTTPWRNERANILRYGISRFPTSLPLVNSHFNDRLKYINDYETPCPKQAESQYQELIDQIHSVQQNSKNLPAHTPLRIKIEKSAQKFRRRLVKKNLIGQPAPNLNDVTWLQKPAKLGGDNEFPQIVLFFKWGSGNATDSLVELHRQIYEAKSLAAELIAVVPNQGLDFNWLNSFTKNVPIQPEQIAQQHARIRRSLTQRLKYNSSFGCSTKPVDLADKFGMTDFPCAVIISATGVVTNVFSGKDIHINISKCLQK